MSLAKRKYSYFMSFLTHFNFSELRFGNFFRPYGKKITRGRVIFICAIIFSITTVRHKNWILELRNAIYPHGYLSQVTKSNISEGNNHNVLEQPDFSSSKATRSFGFIENELDNGKFKENANVDHKSNLTQYSSFIYGVYLDYRSVPAIVRVLMLRKCIREEMTQNTMQMKLHLVNEADIVLSNLTVETPIARCPKFERLICNWVLHRPSAEIPAASQVGISGVTLIRQDYSTLIIPDSKIRLIHSTNKPKIQLAVCVAPLYLTADWLQLVQFVEVWRSQGAEKIIIYYQSVSVTVMSFLRAYESENLVEIIPWSPFPTDKYANFDANLDTYRLGQSIAENDCMYRTAEMAKFVAKVDLDELIIPHSGVLINFLEDALKQQSNAGAFFFMPRPLVFAKPVIREREARVNLEEIDFSYLTSSFHESEETIRETTIEKHGKTVILPQRTETVFIHSAKTLEGFEQVDVPLENSVSYLHQRYNFEEIKHKIINASYPLSLETVAVIQKNYNFLVQKHFGENFSAFVDKHILHIFGSCWKFHNGIRRTCKAPMDKCSYLVKNLTEWIFVDEYSFLTL